MRSSLSGPHLWPECYKKNVKLTHNSTPSGKERFVTWSSPFALVDQLTGGHGGHGWGTLDTVGEVAWLRSTGGGCVSLESEYGKVFEVMTDRQMDKWREIVDSTPVSGRVRITLTCSMQFLVLPVSKRNFSCSWRLLKKLWVISNVPDLIIAGLHWLCCCLWWWYWLAQINPFWPIPFPNRITHAWKGNFW